jgi:hypothetical protein
MALTETQRDTRLGMVTQEVPSRPLRRLTWRCSCPTHNTGFDKKENIS